MLRSDEVRKSLCGVPPLTALGADAYRPEISEQVYATLAELGAQIARTGHGVVVDAVCAEAAARDSIEAAARRAGTAFVGLWLDAPESVMVARVRRAPATRRMPTPASCASSWRNPWCINWHRVTRPPVAKPSWTWRDRSA